MKNLIVFFLGIAILSIGACTKKVDTEADVAAINNLLEEFDEALNASDLDGLMSYFTEDAVRMPPSRPALVGKEAIRDMFQSRFEHSTTEVHNTSEEVIVCGDWAIVRGTHTVTVALKMSGESIRDNGKWITIWQRQPDGSWKLYSGFYNSDLPPTGAQ